ncbi:hypothetical protein B0H14DRAFT_3890373 [Mycena olivaceomarginata]|nr:hypothetical protein B0H14DRAFT_3890373 [Mycena olivaceomarginata]
MVLTESTPRIDVEDPVLETGEERERFWEELVKEREIERETAIAEGKMDDPTRYRREREDDLFEWEKVGLLVGFEDNQEPACCHGGARLCIASASTARDMGAAPHRARRSLPPACLWGRLSSEHAAEFGGNHYLVTVSETPLASLLLASTPASLPPSLAPPSGAPPG